MPTINCSFATCRICGALYVENEMLTEPRFINMCEKCKQDEQNKEDIGKDFWDI